MSTNTAEKRIVFLTPSTGKQSSTAMLKAIDGQPVKQHQNAEPAPPIEIALAGPLSHLQPLADELDRRKKHRSTQAKQPATKATRKATGAKSKPAKA